MMRYSMAVVFVLLAGCSLFGEEKEDSRCSGWRSEFVATADEVLSARFLTDRVKQHRRNKLELLTTEMQAAGCENIPNIPSVLF